MTIKHDAWAHCMSDKEHKKAHTHSEYLMVIAFPQQQWSDEVLFVRFHHYSLL